MKIGILIVFRNAATAIEVQQLIELFTNRNKLDICFVNNESNDQTLKLLKEIKEEVNTPIAIIDVKKSRGHNAGIKAGVRYLTSKNDVPYILCLQKFAPNDMELLKTVFHMIEVEKEVIINLFKRTKRIVHKNVYSLRSVLERAS